MVQYLHFRILKISHWLYWNILFKLMIWGSHYLGHPRCWRFPPPHSQDPLDSLQWQTYKKTEEFGWKQHPGFPCRFVPHMHPRNFLTWLLCFSGKHWYVRGKINGALCRSSQFYRFTADIEPLCVPHRFSNLFHPLNQQLDNSPSSVCQIRSWAGQRSVGQQVPSIAR